MPTTGLGGSPTYIHTFMGRRRRVRGWVNKAELEANGTRVTEFTRWGISSSFNLLCEVSFPHCEMGPMTWQLPRSYKQITTDHPQKGLSLEPSTEAVLRKYWQLIFKQIINQSDLESKTWVCGRILGWMSPGAGSMEEGLDVLWPKALVFSATDFPSPSQV